MNKTVAVVLISVALVAAYLTITNTPSSTSTGAFAATQQASAQDTGSDVVLLGLGRDGNYNPQVITFKQGVPTRFKNDGTLAGCALYPVQPELGLAANFAKSDEIIFTAKKKGRFPYSCSMGMMRGTIEVV